MKEKSRPTGAKLKTGEPVLHLLNSQRRGIQSAIRANGSELSSAEMKSEAAQGYQPISGEGWPLNYTLLDDH